MFGLIPLVDPHLVRRVRGRICVKDINVACFYKGMFGLIHLVDPHLVRRVRGHVYVLGISMLHLFLRGDVWTDSSS